MIIFFTVSTIRSKLNPRNLLFFCLLFFVGGLSLEFATGAPTSKESKEQESSASRSIFALPEPRAMRPAVMEEIPGSDRTIRTFARIVHGETVMLSKEEVEALDKAGPAWRDEATRAPAPLWEGIEIQYLRDTESVIIGAVLEGESQKTCSVLFDPELVQRMEDIFGPEFYVAVPSRFRLMVFPKLATRIREFAPVILSDHRVSAYPVSPEVFEVSKDGVQVVGILDDR